MLLLVDRTLHFYFVDFQARHAAGPSVFHATAPYDSTQGGIALYGKA